MNMLGNLVRNHKPRIIFLAEPMTDFSNAHTRFFQSFDLTLIAFSSNSAKVAKLWCLGDANLNITVLHSSMQYIAISVMLQGISLNLAGLYAPNFYIRRHSIWSALSNLLGPGALLEILMLSFHLRNLKGVILLIISLALIFVFGLTPIVYLFFHFRALLSLGLMVD